MTILYLSLIPYHAFLFWDQGFLISLILLFDSIIYRNIHFESDVVRWWFHFYQWIPYHDLLFWSFSSPFLLLLKIHIRAVMHFEWFSMWWWFHFYSQVFRPLANALSTWINQYLLKNLLTVDQYVLKKTVDLCENDSQVRDFL